MGVNMFSCDADKILSMSLISKFGGDWQGTMTCWPEIIFSPQLSFDDSFSSIPIAVVLTDFASQDWVNIIPQELIPRLIAFEQLWLGDAYMALYLISRSEEALNLFKNNLGLFWYVLGGCTYWHLAEILQLFRERKKKILSFLDLPEETAVFNLFKKLNLLRPSDEVFKGLTTIIKSGVYKELLHVSLITNDLVCLLAEYPALAKSRLIQCYQPAWEYFYFSSCLRGATSLAIDSGLDVQWVARKLSGNNPQKIVEKIDERVTNIYVKQNEETQRKKPNCNYPKPFIGGNKYINPISKYYELLNESEEQGHCVQSFHEMVLDGSTYFYQMKVPERATIQISVDENGQLYLEEVKLKNNDEPTLETEQAIFEWLAASGRNVDLDDYKSLTHWDERGYTQLMEEVMSF